MKNIALYVLATIAFATMGCDQLSSRDKAKADSASLKANESSKNIEDSARTNLPTYNVATISTFMPFIFRDENGNTVGFDVDILKAIGEKQGFNVVYLVVPWNGIFDTVNSGTHDIISSAVVITPDRQRLVDFSDPYITSGRMAVVREDLKDKTIDELQNKKFVTQAGTSNVPILEEIVSDPSNINGVDTQFLEIQEVMQGKADVAFDDSRVMQYYVAQYPELFGINYDEYPGDNFGFGVKKGRADLLEKINNGLAEIKADGTYNEIYKKWFGVLPGSNN